MIRRNVTDDLRDSLGDTPVILVIGARQVGKSTLVQSLGIENYQSNYLTFDDLTILSAAKANPKAFIESVEKPVIFDEVQRVPEIFLPIKEIVDQKREAGNFLLTGSANVLLLPKIADSLAGRMEVLPLYPLSQGEIEGVKENFIEWICADDFKLPKTLETESREKLFERILTGGYPEVLERKTEKRRRTWFNSYITTILQRDVRDLANIEGLSDFPRLLSVLAARAAGLINYADISRASGLPQTTLKRYLTILKSLFLIEEIPSYSGNLTRRLVKSPKLIFTDTGLLAYLQNLTWEKIKFEPTLAGLILENFVFGEIRKQQSWSEIPFEILHFRTSNDREVDIILELANSEIIGIEIKSGASVSDKSFRGLQVLEETVGKKFKRGIVLYAGDKAVAFDKKMFAIPVETLWKRTI
jgi:predicted AAA+ superfamily ATPase